MVAHRRTVNTAPTESAPPPLSPSILSSLVAPLVEAFNDRISRVEKLIEERHADNMKRRHDQNGRLDTLDNKAYILGERMTVLEHRMKSLDGGDTGNGGIVSKLEQGQVKLDHKTAELKSDLRSLQDISPTSPQMQEMQAWKNKWLGVAAAVSIAGTVFALTAGIIAALWAVFHHLT